MEMKISKIDHLVLTTKNLDACLKFYGEILGMEIFCKENRYSLKFGDQKINIHTCPTEFLPAAANPQVGALDICFVIEEPLENILRELKSKGVEPITEIVLRNGALGKMRSIYLRDPDGNLIELCNYSNFIT